jgi:hypothetical protein
MRKFLALFALLAASLFMLQSTMAATAAYEGCCIEGCQGMAQCVSLSCQVCAAPAAVPVAPALVFELDEANTMGRFGAPLRPPPFAAIWTPPD